MKPRRAVPQPTPLPNAGMTFGESLMCNTAARSRGFQGDDHQLMDSKYTGSTDGRCGVIQSAGLRGPRHVSLSPAGNDSFVKDGNEIGPQPALEDLINTLFASFTSSGKSDSEEKTRK